FDAALPKSPEDSGTRADGGSESDQAQSRFSRSHETHYLQLHHQVPDGARGRSIAERQLWNRGSGLRGGLRLPGQFHIRVQEILREAAAQRDLAGSHAVFPQRLMQLDIKV